MQVAQLGERRVIERLLQTLPRSLQGWRDLLLGPGDDCAMVRTAGNTAWLITTDQQIEGTHFAWSWSRPAQLGYRAAAVTLSDIGAMGGTPRFLLVNLGLTPRTPVATVVQFYRGMRALLARHRVALIGGDTSAAPCFYASLTAIGRINPARAVTRGGARPGDLIMVTGTLGDAAAGLQLLRRGRHRRQMDAMTRALVRRELDPTPRLAAGRALAEHRLATAMLDLSDGLAIDLGRLCRASGVGASLRLERLPLSPALIAYARRRRLDPRRLALAGGEDYELLFTVRPAAATRCLQLLRRWRLAGRCIGEIRRASGRAPITVLEGGRSTPLQAATGGFEHFRASTARDRR